MDRDNALDYADRRPALLERSALFDVQLEVAMPRARLADRLLDAIGIAANFSDAVGAAQAVPHLIEIAGLQIARDDAARRGAAAECRALLVRPQHHFERMTRREACRLAGLNHLECR